MKFFAHEFLFLGVLLGAFCGPAAFADSPAPIRKNLPSDVLRFRYETYDRTKALNCKHALSNAAVSPYDWDVKCFHEDGRLAKRFDVHLALSIYERTTLPRLSIELLYWISGEGATTWFHFNDPTTLRSLQTGQTVERGVAGLYLEIAAPPTLRSSR